MATNPKDQMRPLEASARMMQSLDAVHERAKLLPITRATKQMSETKRDLVLAIKDAIKLTHQLEEQYIEGGAV